MQWAKDGRYLIGAYKTSPCHQDLIFFRDQYSYLILYSYNVYYIADSLPRYTSLLSSIYLVLIEP